MRTAICSPCGGRAILSSTPPEVPDISNENRSRTDCCRILAPIIRIALTVAAFSCFVFFLPSCSLFEGQKTVTYAVYTVKPGDTLYEIAVRFKSSIAEIRRVNRIPDPDRLEVGQVIRIPYRGQAVGPPGGGAGEEGVDPRGIPRDEESMRTIRLNAARKYIGALAWPLSRPRITSKFGSRWLSFHEGLDFGGRIGTPVFAAHDGVVVYSDSRMRGYGNMVIVRGNSILTVYAHNDRNLVEKGERVSRGEKIAYLGKSGKATGPHLHYETRIRTPQGKYAAVDPLVFYP